MVSLFKLPFVSINNVISATQAASKSLLDAIGEVYESQWTGHDQLYILTQSVDNLWQDFSHKLADQVLLPLNTYQSQFPEMRVTNHFHPTLNHTNSLHLNRKRLISVEGNWWTMTVRGTVFRPSKPI